MPLPLFGVDAFADQPFAGNPAAVCLLAEPLPTPRLQLIAREMSCSETAFVLPQAGHFSLRWFTAGMVEVDLCGHATLAAAHILWETGRLRPNEPAHFQTRSGPLAARRNGTWIEMDFPAAPAVPATLPPEFLQALGVTPIFIGQFGPKHLLEVEDAASIRHLSPDFAALKKLPGRGVVVTSPADRPGYDFISRYFAPWVGVDEDPVTGSAHCCLGPYWKDRLGKDSLMAYQASARGGTIRVSVAGSRVWLAGQALTTWRGELAQL